jgi:hypothetical protein
VTDPVVADPVRLDRAGAERDVVAALLGRRPQGQFEVVVRTTEGSPMVIRNSPLLDDGTPMPTRYWLVDPVVRSAIGRLEADLGVRRAEAEIDPAEIAAAHDRYRAERDAALPDDHLGPRPSAGVGGTRQGVKCLHAHYAWFLAGGDDPVGRWVHDRLSVHLPTGEPRPEPLPLLGLGS